MIRKANMIDFIDEEEGLDTLIALLTGRIRPWVPNPTETEGQAIRFCHRDLEEKDDRDLESEREFLLVVRFWAGPGEWEEERMDMIEEELRRRRAIAAKSGAVGQRDRRPEAPEKTPKQIARIDDLLAKEGGA